MQCIAVFKLVLKPGENVRAGVWAYFELYSTTSKARGPQKPLNAA